MTAPAAPATGMEPESVELVMLVPPEGIAYGNLYATVQAAEHDLKAYSQPHLWRIARVRISEIPEQEASDGE